jgi:tetratricopeptide (TPR) repeat protein
MLSKQKLIIYIFLTLATFAVYWQVNQFEFINLDDQVYVTENNHIQSGILTNGIRWAFTTTYAEFWHPLTWISLMLDYQFYGLNAGGYHVTNLILHILSTLLLFWLFNRMTGVVWKSAFVAALFALHPLHVESVAWIAERKDVLSAFFWMLTLCLYVYYVEKPAVRRYLLVLFSFVLALMSKPMVVTLPVIMILLDYWPLGRFEFRKDNPFLWQLKEKLPFFVLSAAFSIVTLLAQNKPNIKHFPLNTRLANAPVSFITYLEKTFWPHNLAAFYPFPTQIPVWQVVTASLLIILISAAVIAAMKRLPYLFAGWLWYSITILPVTGIVPVGNFAMADRYHYLPSIGIAVMLAWGIPYLIKSENFRKKILLPAGVILFAALSFLSWRQCGYWQNSIELFSHALRVTQNNHLAHNNIGIAISDKGKLKEAIYHYNKAISIKQDYAPPYIGRGVVYARLGQYQRAIEDFNQATRLNHDDFLPYYNRGFIFAKFAQYQLAIDNFSEAIRLKPEYTDSYNNRAAVYLNMGNIEFGCSDAQKACESRNCSTLQAAKNKGLCH